jgi:hypothetical protein
MKRLKEIVKLLQLMLAAATGPHACGRVVQPAPRFVHVPKMQIQINAYPIVTRNDISNKFSLRDYATGALINRKSGGGMW